MRLATDGASLISRRRFLQGSGVALLGLTAVAVGPRGSDAAATPPQPATTLTALLEVATFSIPTVGEPHRLLELAQVRGMTPDALVAALSEDCADTVALTLSGIDATWPYATLLGNQPEEARREALEWAVGLREERPGLELRSDPPPVQDYDANAGIEARNASWRAGAALLLRLSATAAQVIANPPESSETLDEPEATAPETTTIEP